MIYVPEERLDQVEYLIDQSLQGNHVLFDAEILKRALSSPVALSQRSIDGNGGDYGDAGSGSHDEAAYAVEPHIERVLEQPTFDQKRAYLESLDPATLEHVVRAYFNIVENSLFERLSERSVREGEVRH